MKKFFISVGILVFVVLVAWLVQSQYRTSRERTVAYLKEQGYTNIQLDQKLFGTCCGWFTGCKGAGTYDFVAYKFGRKYTGRACYKNCLWGKKQVLICDERGDHHLGAVKDKAQKGPAIAGPFFNFLIIFTFVVSHSTLLPSL